MDQKAHVLRKNGKGFGSCSLLDAADHLSTSSHPTTSLLPRCCPAYNYRERCLQGPRVSVSFSSLFSSFAGVSSSSHPVVTRLLIVPLLPSFSFLHHPWTPPTAYKSQTLEAPPEARRVLSRSNPHHQPPSLNRRGNGRPTPSSPHSTNHTKFQMTIFQHTATSIPTPQQWPMLPLTAVPFPSSVRTCYFRPWGRVSSVGSNSVSICDGG